MSKRLERFVRDVRMLDDIRAGERQARIIPDGAARLMVRVLEDGRAHLIVAGPRSRALFKTIPPARFAVLVDFKPGAALPVLGVPMSQLVDRYVALDELWGAGTRSLLQGVQKSTGSADAWPRLHVALDERVACAFEPASSLLARRAIAALSNQEDGGSLGALAARLGVTPRHLRRAFGEAVGVSPRELSRMLPLRRALDAARDERRWSEVALEAGYCDQPHLIAEFRDLVGMTPSEYTKRWPRRSNP